MEDRISSPLFFRCALRLNRSSCRFLNSCMTTSTWSLKLLSASELLIELTSASVITSFSFLALFSLCSFPNPGVVLPSLRALGGLPVPGPAPATPTAPPSRLAIWNESDGLERGDFEFLPPWLFLDISVPSDRFLSIGLIASCVGCTTIEFRFSAFSTWGSITGDGASLRRGEGRRDNALPAGLESGDLPPRPETCWACLKYVSETAGASFPANPGILCCQNVSSADVCIHCPGGFLIMSG
mmetsp:Transcript_36700/g.82684  ORF Transcript_36700/g.82684 Transcript_36700/m.82684 type:complete len:241 (+) Transcript_36700:1107-1829(+)